MTSVLDAWAVLALLGDEQPAAARVEAALEDHPRMSWINLGEVFYVVRRARGEREAMDVVRDLRPVLTLEVPTSDVVLEAARVKSEHAMSYADAFAAATAMAHDAPLMTGDSELLVEGAPWQWIDLRT